MKEEFNHIDDDLIYNLSKFSNDNDNYISEFMTFEMSDKQNLIDIQKSEDFFIPSHHKKNEKIFGRKKKHSTEKGQRNKFSEDNLIHKFKTLFYQKFLINLMNYFIHINGYDFYKIRKVNSKFIKDLSINLNLKVLNSSLADYFSLKISEKYKKHNEYSNKKIIEELKNKNEFNDLLNIKLNALYKIFINDDCENIIKNKFNLKTPIKKIGLKYLLENEKDEEYKQALLKSCKNIYKFFNKNNARKKEI
jgi:hypothetical protein